MLSAGLLDEHDVDITPKARKQRHVEFEEDWVDSESPLPYIDWLEAQLQYGRELENLKNWKDFPG